MGFVISGGHIVMWSADFDEQMMSHNIHKMLYNLGNLAQTSQSPKIEYNGPETLTMDCRSHDCRKFLPKFADVLNQHQKGVSDSHLQGYLPKDLCNLSGFSQKSLRRWEQNFYKHPIGIDTWPPLRTNTVNGCSSTNCCIWSCRIKEMWGWCLCIVWQ